MKSLLPFLAIVTADILGYTNVSEPEVSFDSVLAAFGEGLDAGQGVPGYLTETSPRDACETIIRTTSFIETPTQYTFEKGSLISKRRLERKSIWEEIYVALMEFAQKLCIAFRICREENSKEATDKFTLSAFFALVPRGNCSFVTKARNVQKAGYQGVIVYDEYSDFLIPMHGDDSGDIEIIAAFIGHNSAKLMKNSFLY